MLSNGKCSICQIGYELNNDKTQCIKKEITIEHCASESSSKGKIICDICHIGYFPSLDQKSCVENPNCFLRSENNPSICVLCSDYYYLNSNGKCEFSYCSTKNKNGECTKCYSQFYLNEKKECVKIPFEYCRDGDEDECFDCIDGFVLDDKTCKKKETHCSNDACSASENGYSLNGDQCVDNCESYSTTVTKCEVCENNYIKANNGAECQEVKSKSNYSKYISFSSFVYLIALFALLEFV